MGVKNTREIGMVFWAHWVIKEMVDRATTLPPSTAGSMNKALDNLLITDDPAILQTILLNWRREKPDDQGTKHTVGGTVAKPPGMKICFHHDPANNLSCRAGTSRLIAPLDTTAPDQRKRWDRAKTAFDKGRQ